MNIGFIGGGTMAEAILRGILGQGLASADQVRVGEPVEERRNHLTSAYGVHCTPSNVEALATAELCILAVLPQHLPAVLKDLYGRVQQQQTVLSIIAGARMEAIARGLGHQAVIRGMPNMPAQIGAGVSVWTASAAVPRATREAARAILATLGMEVYVSEERYIDMATALSASGPAYVFLFLETLIDAGVYLGMPREMATALATQTVLGSARMTAETGRHPAELRNAVSSPGGTTVEALRKLEEGGFRAALLQAIAAAYEKSQVLGRPAAADPRPPA